MICPYTPEVFDANEVPAWDSYLHGCQQATVFHTTEWMHTLQDSFGYEPKVMLALGEDGGTSYAALPFMVDTRFGIKNWLSMPFDTYGGVVGDQQYSEGLKRAFFEGMSLGVRYLVDFRGKPKTRVEQVLTEIKDISQPEDVLWNTMHKDNRTAIRYAEKHDVKVSIETEYIPHLFERVHERLAWAITKHMIPAGLCKQVVASVNSEPVAASLFFIYKDQAMYWANTVTEDGRKTNANYLLMWKAIKQARSLGCTSMNLGASPDGADSLVKFKRSWGAEPHEYSKVQYVPALLRPVLALRGIAHG